MYMADGFREKHGYNEKGEIETFRISEHTGILMLFEFPESVTLEINEERSYAIIWIYLGMNIQMKMAPMFLLHRQVLQKRHPLLDELGLCYFPVELVPGGSEVL